VKDGAGYTSAMPEDFRYPERLMVPVPDDPELRRLVMHLIHTWPQRRTVTARQCVIPEAIVNHHEIVQVAESKAHHEIDEMTHRQLIVKQELSWWICPGTSMVTQSIYDYARDAMIPAPGNVIKHARRMANCLPHGKMVVQVKALVLPPLPNRNAENQASLWHRSMDSSGPDTSRPYPLNDLLGDIADLTT
jgi:hypothetical protein